MAPGSSAPTPPSFPDSLLHDLLDVSLTGVNVLRPVYDPAGDIEDFAIEYLNPAGQRMTGLSAQPGGTLLTHFPATLAVGILAYYRRAYAEGYTGLHEVNYQADGLDNYFRLAARRSGELLVVSFTDTADQDRSAVEQALRDSQAAEQAARAEADVQRQRFYEVLMQLPAHVAVHEGPGLVFTFVNPGYQRIANGRDLVGQPIRTVWPELADHGILDILERVYHTGEPFIAAGLPVQADFTRTGQLEQVYYDFFFLALRDAQGQITGVLNFSYDVTSAVQARQQVEQLNQELETRVQARAQELAQSQAETDTQRLRLHQLVAEAPALIASLRGPAHVVELANDGFRAIFGGRELVGKPYRQAVPELEGQPFFGLLDEVYRTGETYYGIDQPVTLDRTNSGQLEDIFVTYIYQATRDAQGHIDGILIFAYEVTEQVLARQEREAQRQQLARVFEQAPVAVALFQGPEYLIEVANTRVAELWGRTLDQVVGRPLFDALPEVRGQGFKELLDQVVATGEAFVAQEVSAVLQRRGQLETVYLNFVYQPLRDAAGHIGSVVAVAVEVTEQVRTRQQVQDLNQELAAINEELLASNDNLGTANHQLQRTNVDLDNFVYTASHDLKAPVSNLEALLTSLRQELPAQAPGSEIAFLLNLMQDSIQRFTHTLDLLTDVTKLQQSFSEGPAVVALAPLIEDVRLDLAPLLGQVGGQLHVDVAATPTVTFAEKNLRSVVHNLVSNAFKYHDPARPAAVTVRSRVEAPFLVLEVQDNGLGLDLSGEHQLFGLFRRFHTHVEGSGVGLHMVKKLVENAGGRVEVKSKLGQGSTFSVYFPC